MLHKDKLRSPMWCRCRDGAEDTNVDRCDAPQMGRSGFGACALYLLGTELVGAGHEVCAKQREADGVAALRGKLQALLEHFLKRAAVEAAHTHTHNTSAHFEIYGQMRAGRFVEGKCLANAGFRAPQSAL